MDLEKPTLTDLPPSTVETIAAHLLQDIRQRGLRHGDRYLTAAEASKMFSVSAVTVNRAMQLLAKRDLLTRQRSRGTFVGPKFQNDNAMNPIIDAIHVLMAMDYHLSQPVSTDTLVGSFVRSLPGTAVDVQFIPEVNALDYIERIVQRLKGSEAVEGIVLVRCSRQAQSCVSNSNIPAVVKGQVYPGIKLSSVEHDQMAVGRLMAEHAISGGYRRCMLLTRNEWRYGDNQMLDAISQTLAAANIPLDGLTIRSMPQERDFVSDAVTTALIESDEPTILLCRSEFFAEAALEAAETAGKRLGVDFEVVSGGQVPPTDPARFGRIQSEMAFSKQIQCLTELLCEAAENPDTPPRTVTVPVAFQEPNRIPLRRRR